MSIQEKKSSKGTPYAIIKFSDEKGEFELFLFAEILIKNRDKLKESESFVITLQKDKIPGETTKKRIYLETLRDVLSGSSKIMIDQNSGNGVVPYLPLNELNKNKQTGNN